MFLFFSVFCGMPIPYPKREFITDDDNDDKSAKVISFLLVKAEDCLQTLITIGILWLFPLNHLHCTLLYANVASVAVIIVVVPILRRLFQHPFQ